MIISARQKMETHTLFRPATIFMIIPFILTLLHHLYKFVQRKLDQRSCYLLAYQCYKPPDELKLTTGNSIKILLRNHNLGLDEYRFLLKIVSRSGIGEETYCSRNFLEGREMSPTFRDSLQEIEEATFSMLDTLFVKSRVSPSQIDILITTASLFAPSPTLSARIVNRYKMKDNIKTFNLSGMGCSSSVVAIDMVRHMFKVRRDSFAVVVAMESTAGQWYGGKDKSMMLSNVLFRSGGSSLLLTNHSRWKERAILKLDEVVPTHLSSDESYGCAIHEEDDQGLLGARLSKDLPKVVSEAIVQNFNALLPKVLPLYEIIRFSTLRHWKTKILKPIQPHSNPPAINLKSGIHHFCIHAGGKAVIEGFGKSFGLDPDRDMEPSRMTLHRFGNTSCSSLWYVLAYMEAKKRLKKGDKLLMVGLGAGFMCNTCTWKVCKDYGVDGGDDEEENVWWDCLDRYPVEKVENSYAEKFGWIFEDCVSFVRFDHGEMFGG